MKLFANPTFLQLAGLFLIIIGFLIFAFLIIRSMRKDITSESKSLSASPRTESLEFATATYQGVITSLKQREQQLLGQLAAEARRVEAVEGLKATLLDNISTGVITFSSNLLVQQANPAARKLLGYASPINMHVKELFSGMHTVELPSSNGALGGISQALRDVFANGAQYRDVPATYSTPQGEGRQFRLILLPVVENGQQVSAALCLLSPPDTAFTLSFPESEADRNILGAE
jgi:PAS domain-containing protein